MALSKISAEAIREDGLSHLKADDQAGEGFPDCTQWLHNQCTKLDKLKTCSPQERAANLLQTVAGCQYYIMRARQGDPRVAAPLLPEICNVLVIVCKKAPRGWRKYEKLRWSCMRSYEFSLLKLKSFSCKGLLQSTDQRLGPHLRASLCISIGQLEDSIERYLHVLQWPQVTKTGLESYAAGASKGWFSARQNAYRALQYANGEEAAQEVRRFFFCGVDLLACYIRDLLCGDVQNTTIAPVYDFEQVTNWLYMKDFLRPRFESRLTDFHKVFDMIHGLKKQLAEKKGHGIEDLDQVQQYVEHISGNLFCPGDMTNSDATLAGTLAKIDRLTLNANTTYHRHQSSNHSSGVRYNETSSNQLEKNQSELHLVLKTAALAYRVRWLFFHGMTDVEREHGLANRHEVAAELQKHISSARQYVEGVVDELPYKVVVARFLPMLLEFQSKGRQLLDFRWPSSEDGHVFNMNSNERSMYTYLNPLHPLRDSLTKVENQVAAISMTGAFRQSVADMWKSFDAIHFCWCLLGAPQHPYHTMERIRPMGLELLRLAVAISLVIQSPFTA